MALGKMGARGGFGGLGAGGGSNKGIRLSGSSFTAGAAQGTAIGTLSVVGGVGTYTFTLTDSHTNAVQVAGTNGVNLQVGLTSSSAGSFNITVHADNGAGSTFDRTFSLSATQAPANTVAPTISGSAVQGATLTAGNGTWTGYPSPAFTYQWKRGGVAITGATNATYVVQNADVGSTITVTVTGTNGIGSPASATSSATATVTKTTLSYTPVTTAANGSAYTGATPSTSGGTAPYGYSVSGTLPAGLSLNSSTGVISGTATVNGTYSGLVLTATDANGVADSSAPFTITVSAVSIQLSASTFLENSAAGTAIGTLSVVGATGTPTFSLSDSHGSAAQTSGSALQVGATASNVGSFNITVSVSGVTPVVPDATFSLLALPRSITLALDSASDSGSSNSDGITNINTPQIDFTFGTTPIAGDIVNVKDGGALLVSHTITSGEISGNTIALGLSALADGAHSLTANHVRASLAGAYSSALAITIDTVAPVLSSQSGAQTAQTTASLSVSTDTGSGTLYAVVTGSATPPSVAQVKAGQDNAGSAAVYAHNQAVSSSGVQTMAATGLNGIQSYYAYWVHSDVAGNNSAVASASWSQADITPPVLTSPAAANATSTTESLSVSTDTGSGTLYIIVSTSSTKPSAAQIQLGQDNTGGVAIWSGNQAVSATGSQSATATGLTLSTNYYAHFMHKDLAGNTSTPISTTSVWQTAAPPALTSPAAAGATASTESLSVSTNTGNGTLYVIVSTSATPPSVAQIQAGNDSSGGAAVWSGNQAVSGAGTQSATATGLSAATNYYAYFQHKDNLNNNSTVAAATQNPWQTSASWTTIFSATLSSNDSGDNGYSQRNLVTITGGAGGGGQIRATFKAAASGIFHTDHCSIGISAGSGSTTTTPVELTFSGGHGFNISNGATITSDGVSLSGFTGSDKLVVIIDFNSTASHGNPAWSGSGSSSGNTEYYKSATASYNSSSAAGFSNLASTVSGVSKIEVQ